MIRFKNIRFNRSVKFLASTKDWFDTGEGYEIWLDDADHLWIKLREFTKLVSGIPFDAEIFPEDAPKSPGELAKKKPAKASADPPAAA